MKIQIISLEKIFVNHTFAKRTASRLYLKLLQLNDKNINELIKNGQKV